jgi:23S rRNA (cytidine1920-2'-O)/16S rRNA (cytidine1409-2'-O)-methyltransferase
MSPPAPAKRRIDRLLVELGLAPSREKAQALIMAGQVLIEDRPITKSGSLVPPDAPIFLRAHLPYVSRGGIKLAHALSHFGLKVQGKAALDVGASTGGFTDCLLKHGARRVYALDVGYGQLALELRQDPRVVALERVNARYPFTLPEAVDLATVDVSFISLTKVIPSVAAHLKAGVPLLALVKPQFEAEREEVQRGGVVRDPRVHGRVLGRVILWAIAGRWRLRGLTPSPLLGDKGNREFFLLLEHA